MKKSTLYLLILFNSIISTGIQAQTGYFYSSDKYLSNSLINTIYQDSRNYIWIATEDGLNKFDGVRFSIYHTDKNSTSSIKNNYVRTVFEDSKGRFWVGCINGLMLYNRAEDTFTEIPVYFHNKLVSPHISSIIETKTGEIWVSTSGTGIIRSNDNYKSFTVDEQLFPELCSRYLVSIFEDLKGNIWIGSGNQGINKYNPKTNKISSYKSPLGIGSNQISSICGDKNGRIFAGSLTGGLYTFDNQKDKFISIPYKYPEITLPVKSLLIDKNQQLLVGTDGLGIKILNKTTQQLEDFEMTSAMFDFSRTKIHTLCQDKSGNLWLGLFQKGVFLSLNQQNTFQYWGPKSYHQNRIGNNCVMSVLRDKQGTLWVGTDNDGLYGINGKTAKHFELKSKTYGISGTIMSILEGDNSTLWLAFFFDGLLKFDKQSGNITRFANTASELSKNTAANKAMSIARDAKNRIWIGTNGAGVQIFDIASQQFAGEYLFNEADSSGIANNWVNCIKRDGDNVMWIGTYDGVSNINVSNGKITTYRTRNGVLPGNVVLTIAKDHTGKMWFGTTEGLACFNPSSGQSEIFTVANGLAGNVVCGIQEDENGNMWISTHSGISKFVKSTKSFINYYSYDGLQGNEFSTGAYFKSENGEMIFGGVAGITAFYPQQIADRKSKLQLFLTGLNLPDKKVVMGMKSGWHTIIDNFISDVDKIRLNYNDNTFSLEFSTFDFGSPERVYYRYKIDGINNQWINTEKGISRISFTNLSYGNYKLRIKACINNLESPEKELEIIIYPPWYLSWPAKLFYFVAFIFVGWLVFRVIMERLNYKQEMIRREHLEQINEGKLQFFINISHEIRTPMSLIISPLERLISENTESDKQPVYRLMYRNAQRILHLINQLLDVRKIDKGQMFVKMSETNIISFINDLMNTFEYQAKKRNIRFIFQHSFTDLKAWIDVNNFDKVLVNILSNAFKFTPENGEINIILSTGEDKNAPTPELKNFFEIIVSDNGIGIEEDKIEKIFERFYQIDNAQANVNFGTGIGLHLAKNLVELMHGRIFARNKTNENGSEFIIRLPLGNNHLNATEIKSIQEENALHLHKSNENSLIEQSDSSKQKKRAKTKYRILVVDDEDDIRQYLDSELSEIYRISTCINGKQALDFILREKPDLIISDVMMPEMDGITLCKKLKSNININHIPVILLTAKTSDEDKAEGIDTGADAYIPKPFNVELLKKQIANLISNRERLETKAIDNEENKALIKQIVLKPNDQILLEKILKIINENIADSELNVEMLADGVGMSRVHMHRKLKELTNQSARDFIKSIRLKQAAELLSNNKLTVSEVAYALGFSNLSHFSNTFREYYGKSPKEYCQNNGDNREDTDN
ncbi:MAG: two-component regulator propeller domain-containing protein [Paludibacter sp.]